MKLNDDQRKVMQSILDGKNVKISLISTKPPMQDFTFSHLYDVGDGDTQYRIEEPPIKVALFQGVYGVVAHTEEYSKEYGMECNRISDWVEIVPNLLVPTRSDES